MLPKLPSALSKVASQLSKIKPKPKLTTEEKIALLKDKYGLFHGKGKRKRKNKKK